MMRAGELRHLVDVEQYVESTDTAGQPIKTYTVLARRWAGIRHLRGQELYRAQERFAAANVEIKMRYFDGLNATMRIRYRGEVYNILDVNDVDMRRIEYLVLCETGLVSEDSE